MGPRYPKHLLVSGTLLRQRVWMMAFATWALAAADCAPASAAEAPPVKRQFNVPSGAAADALRTFSTQSGQEVVFAAETPVGVKANAVVGQYAPSEAVKLLLKGTGLTAKQDPASGAFMVNRARAPNVSEALPPASPSPPNFPQKKTPAPDVMKPSTLLSILSLLAFGAAEASAQTAPVAPATSETVELSPFMVTS